ncbi:carboxypeptidase regulatory-like domain-containing protein [Chryseobacterium sp. JUb7]|uniref:carboxypeptidase regulatory-like domain-containing protein n=1 Tax=Chryseobacterium sp. JUb7 TaxID=2940599 RepID=UPI00216798F2|nr:carboxypeptidase regulatory-like domain-containing protein [Chryseobacterium sp. JUb7]MCS3530904.1 hypothetical protein [Chryseobacterium sp. JUb7]
MKFFLIILTLFLGESIFAQRILHGRITGESKGVITDVLVINISNGHKIYTDFSGDFSIEASDNDIIRFTKPYYERAEIRVTSLTNDLSVMMIRTPEEIEEIKLLKLTGDLSKDSKAVTKVDKAKIVQDAVGIPQPVGKMRTTPAEVKVVIINALLGNLDVQALYDLISGDARRMKRRYRYDDLQDDVKWVRDRVDNEYFIKLGIPETRISEFIEFSFVNRPQVRNFVRRKKLEAVLSRMEDSIPVFVKRLNGNKLQN